MDDLAAKAELARLLAHALEEADRLGLTMVAIHIDEARNLLAMPTPTSPSTSTH